MTIGKPSISVTAPSGAVDAAQQLEVLQQILGSAAAALAVVAGSSVSLEIGGPGGDRVLGFDETARLLDISADTLRRMRARGEGPPSIQMSPRRIGFRLSGVRQYIAEREAENGAAT